MQKWESPYGDPIKSGNEVRTYGLGMRTESCGIIPCMGGEDQENENVAETAMGRRISMVTSVCVVHGCSSTDIAIAAALSENGGEFTATNIKALIKQEEASGSGQLNWSQYFNGSSSYNNSYNQKLLTQFANIVEGLGRAEGAYIPPNIDWGEIYRLGTNAQ